jgi:hypothetical protein
MREIKVYSIVVIHLTEKDHLGDSGLDGRTILNWILNKALVDSHEISSFIKGGEFLDQLRDC